MPTITLDRLRPRRAVAALALTAALAGGTAVAHAPHASAAPATTSTTATVGGAGTATLGTAAAAKTPTASLRVSKRTVLKRPGAVQALYTVTAKTPGGSPLKGRAKLVIRGSVVATKKLDSRGTAGWRPKSGFYKVGSNRVQIVVVPAAETGLAKKSTRTVVVTAKKPQTQGAKVVQVAKSYVGARYVHGGSSPSGFDCSGLTSYVYKKAVGKTLPRSSSAQRSAGTPVPRSKARPGDLIWTPGHVAIYIGNGRQIDAGRPGTGVVQRPIWQSNPTFLRV